MSVNLKERPEALEDFLTRRADSDPSLLEEGTIQLSAQSSERLIMRMRRHDSFKAVSLAKGGKRVMR